MRARINEPRTVQVKGRRSDYLFNWKSKRWPHEELRKFVDTFKSSGTVKDTWSCAAHLQIHDGDQAYFLSQDKRLGIFGRGRVVGEPFEVEKTPGENPWKVLIRFDASLGDVLVDPWQRLLVEKEQLLRMPAAQRFTRIQKAGERLESGTARQIDRIIAGSTPEGQAPQEIERQKTLEQQARSSLSQLVTHVFAHQNSPISGLTYRELAFRIGRLNKRGEGHARGMGRVLGVLGHLLQGIDEGHRGEPIPDIQSLAIAKTGKNRGLPDDGIKEFWPDYPHLTRPEKENRTRSEYEKILAFGRRWDDVLIKLGIQPATDRSIAGGTPEGEAAQEIERQKKLGEQASRPGQQAFSETIRWNYRNRCAVTGCVTPAALEAAHISTRTGCDDNSPANGILLRSDIHALFDRFLITLSEDCARVEVGRELTDPSYAFLETVAVARPDKDAPSTENLRKHRDRFFERQKQCSGNLGDAKGRRLQKRGGVSRVISPDL